MSSAKAPTKWSPTTPRAATILRRIAVGRVPKGFRLLADGTRLYVANSWSDTVSEIDTASLTVVRTLPAGFEPNAAVIGSTPAASSTSRTASATTSRSWTSRTGQEVKRLAAGRGASYLALSPDGASIYCTHIYPYPATFRTPPESEITVIDTARQTVVERERLHNAAGVFHVALSARRPARNGRAASSQEPDPAGARGARLGVRQFALGVRRRTSANWCRSRSTSSTATTRRRSASRSRPTRASAYISTTGSDSVTVIDIAALVRFIRAASPEERRTLANDLSASANYVVGAHPGRPQRPKGSRSRPTARRLYVANRLDDTISVIDTAARKRRGTLIARQARRR